MSASPATVLTLEAWGEITDASGGGTSCTVREFARLSDGREVPLLNDRGWTTSAPPHAITLSQIVRNIANVVLPDDAEQTGEEHEWQRFEQRLRAAGIAVTAYQLRALPYRVIVISPWSSVRWPAE